MFVLFFLVLTGMTFDLGVLLGSAPSMLLVPLFLGLFLVVRGLSFGCVSGVAWLLPRCYHSTPIHGDPR